MELKQLILNRPAWLTSSESEGSEHVILSSEVSIQRNLAKFPFPAKCSVQQKSELFKLVTESVQERGILGDAPLSINLMEVSDIAKTLLFERDFLPMSTIHASGDRGVLVDEKGTVLLINSDNHLKLSSHCEPEQVHETWEKLNTIDTLMGKEFAFAYSGELGFLLSRPDQCGSGLSVTYTLHLPGLVHTGTLEQVLSGATQLGMSGEGKFRHGADCWGALFTLTAGNYIGDSEEEILRNAGEAIAEIVEKEREARDTLFSEAEIEMSDKVWRSYGILRHCRMLSVPQLINLTSTLRLGIERGMDVEGLTVSHIDAMIASSLQGSVALLMENEAKEGSELDIQRAEVVRTILKV